MFGQLYERALAGERCFIRYRSGGRTELPVQRWLGHCSEDQPFDDAVIAMCDGSTVELGCGPGRLIARLRKAGIPALGIDRSPEAVRLAHTLGAPAMCADVFGPLPAIGSWQTVLLIDGNVGLEGDPERILRRSRDLLADGGHCVAEFDVQHSGETPVLVRLETDTESGPWFHWSTVGIDCADELAERAGLRLKDVQVIGDRALASLGRV
ncbi:methyltransferase domain-containing protein [Mycobacterium sp. pW049]|uniref:methyltransferase domain-containing protein n=1 Tax=[Mycobacterium] bulgaricum TaxID=3238985 RepID=UPI00351B1799